jgi:hypothetical protein
METDPDKRESAVKRERNFIEIVNVIAVWRRDNIFAAGPTVAREPRMYIRGFDRF